MEVEVGKDSAVSDVKKVVESNWQVKPRHQKLVAGMDVLLDYESIELVVARTSCPQDEMLVVQVICGEQPLPLLRSAGLEKLIAGLGAPDSQMRRGAISSLVGAIDVAQQRELDWFANTVAAHALSAVSVSTKRAGLEALARVSPAGHDLSIRVASRCLEDHNEFVRLTAVEAVTKLAPRGHENTIFAMKRLARNRFPAVRAAALLVLGGIAQDTGFIGAFLEDEHEEVRNAASEAMMMRAPRP